MRQRKQDGRPKAVTIRDVALRAQVSVATVSRVMNGNTQVLPPIRDAVLAAVKELDYRPNLAAQGLRRIRKKAIGLLMEDLGNPYLLAGHRAALRRAAELGYQVVTADAHGSEEMALSLLSQFSSRNVDGIAAAAPFSVVERALQTRPASLPTVFWASPNLTQEMEDGVRYVPLDERAGIMEALEHLRQLGHGLVGVVGFGGAWVVGREDALAVALEANGLRLLRANHVKTLEESFGATVDVLTGAERPTALLVQPHQALPTVLQAVRALRLRIPEDVSLIAFGDSDWLTAMTPQVSALALPIEEVAYQGIDQLAAMIEGRTVAPDVAAPRMRYIRRGSVGPAVVGAGRGA